MAWQWTEAGSWFTAPEPDPTWWALPGGGPELGESSDATIVRELREELSEEVKVIRPLWLLENFYADDFGGQEHHELSIVYLVTLDPASKILDRRGTFQAGTEGYGDLSWLWLSLDSLDSAFPLYPAFFREALHDLPTSFQHAIYRQPRDT